MQQLESILDMRNYIESKGFTILPIKKSEGVYKVVVFRGDKFLKEGKHEYKCSHKALEETEKDFYTVLSTGAPIKDFKKHYDCVLVDK